MVVESTQTLTEMSTTNIFLGRGVKAASTMTDNLTTFMYRMS